MTSQSRRAAQEALTACLRLQRYRIDVASGLRTGITTLVVVAICLSLGQISVGTSMALGIVLVGMADLTEAYRVRMRSLLWCTLWCSAATLLGGLVGEFTVAHVIVAFAIAAVCGLACGLGPRGSLIGTLALVFFSCFAGSEIGVDTAFLDALCVAAGGLLAVAVALAPWPLNRLGSVRLCVMRAYEEFARATTRTGIDLVAPTVASEIMSANAAVDHSCVAGESRVWLAGLMQDLERARLTMLGFFAIRDTSPDYASAVIHASGDLADAIGKKLVGRRADISSARDALIALRAQAPDQDLAVLIDDMIAALTSAADRVEAPWPVGRRASVESRPYPRISVVARLKSHFHAKDAIVEHALRLSFAYGVATVIAVNIDVPHSYWMPLTVAWIAKPDLAGTVTRVTARVAGTLLGVIAVALLVYSIRDLPGREYILVLGVAFGGYLVNAFLWANYPVAVIGITSVVLLLEALAGGNSQSEVQERIGFTLLAGLWVLIVSLTRPRRSGSTALDAIARTSMSLRAYATSVRLGEGMTEARVVSLRERTAAAAAIGAAASEPAGVWERPGPAIDPEEAAALLMDAMDAAAAIVTEELLHERGRDNADLWSQIDESLDSLDERIEIARTRR